MSPVIRKWGMRGVVALCIAAFSAVGMVAYVGVFAAVNGELATAPVAQTDLPGGESWWLALDRYGLPLVILAIISYYVRKAVIAAWEYFKPLGEGVVQEYRSTMRKQGEFAENANTLLVKSVESDKANAIKIDDLHEKVTDMHVNGVIVKKGHCA